MKVEEYLTDPCGASSLPYWKTETVTVPPGIRIVRDDAFDPARPGGRDEPYFKLMHPLQSIKEPVLPGGYTLARCGIEDYVNQINACYACEHLTEEELLISTKQVEGFTAEQDRGVTVVLDTNLTDELLEEGFVREIISKVQTMRKEADFEVTDHIRVTYDGSDKVKEVMDANRALIAGEVLADALEQGEARGYTKEWKINGEEAVFGVEKI